MRAVLAGIIYALVVFAAGIVISLLRIGFLAPETGNVAGYILEFFVILAISWFVADETMARMRIAAGIPPRLIMGAVAFAVLMICEINLTNVLFGYSLTTYIASMHQFSGALEFLGQVLFGLIPALLWVGRRTPTL